ncbi:MAG TPA: glycosyltransferase family 39 protein [Candidatus Methylomirabilis sp.]|nr:glycosyltransferase family 39 protein [Candidatus Methylomirabilis sp.]
MKRAIQRILTSLTLIVIVALGARIAFAWDQARKVPPGVLGIVPFQQEVGNIAAALAQGRGFSDVFRTGTGATAWLAPVYPLVVAAIFKLFGTFTTRAFFAACFLNIVFSSAACVPVFCAGKRLGGLGLASAAAWLWALFPNAVMIPFEWIWDTSLSGLLAATLLWATLALAGSKRLGHWCAYGVLCGFALLTNPALGVLLPFLLAWAACRGTGEDRLKWRRAASAAGIAILCCVPWTARNYAAFHRLIPLRSNLPFELWLGNNDIFDEHALGGRRVITRTEEARRYTHIGETQYMQEKWQLAASFIRSHPRLELRLTGRRLLGFWMGTDSPVTNFVDSHSWLIRTILLCSFLSAAGALVGILVLWTRRIAGTFALAAFPLVFPCLYYVTHADLRYRHPVDPVVLLLAAAVWGFARPERKDTSAAVGT